MDKHFLKESIDYMINTDIKYRKSLGQYFTPRPIRDYLVGLLPKNIKNPKILDPSCGTGEFLITALEYFPNSILEGWEIDEKLCKITKKIIPNANVKNVDSLALESKAKFDLIIGNPPYFEYTPAKEILNKYKEVISGRTNIFAFFIKLGIDLLSVNGYLAFVVPPSMNNGAYFKKLREYIVKKTNIECIKILESTDLFHKAQQLTMVIVLKKAKNTGNYQFKMNNINIFSENWQELMNMFKGKKTLFELGFSVKTGNVVWNQKKSELTDDASKTLLIWSHNIGENGEIVLNNKKNKKQFIDLENPNIGPAIVVNRVTGAAKSAKLRAALIKPGCKFFAENHCNIIFPNKNTDPDLKMSLEHILKQLRSKDKLNVIRSITGNTQISKTELEKLFPIDPI